MKLKTLIEMQQIGLIMTAFGLFCSLAIGFEVNLDAAILVLLGIAPAAGMALFAKVYRVVNYTG